MARGVGPVEAAWRWSGYVSKSTKCHNLRLHRSVLEKKLFEDREVLNELDGVLREDSGNDRQFSVFVKFSFVKFFVL